MSKVSDRPPLPQSVRHKRILDLAEERPDATLKDIAVEVPTATVDLVERVLEQYGDPAAAANGAEQASSQAKSDPGTALMVEDISEKQRETVRVIAANPDATQRELGEMMDVSAATISTRVNAIDGFDWDRRQSIVDGLIDELPTEHEDDTMSSEKTAVNGQFEQVIERIADVEERIEDIADDTRETTLGVDAGLSHKVIHACMESDHLGEEEELRLLRAIVQS